MSFPSILIQPSSLVYSSLDQLISRLVYQILPDSSPTRIEHQILKSYFSLILAISLSIALIKLTRLISPFAKSSTHAHLSGFTFDHQRSIVDIYIDFNHFQPTSSHPSICSLLLHFNSIVHQSLQSSPQSLTLVYWSYIDRTRPELSDWIDQLDLLESHFQHGIVQVIDTSQRSTQSLPKLAQKPLLHDMLKILNVSPPGRLYVVSSSDPDLYGAGFQLIKNHPNSPILAYIPPYGSGSSEEEIVESITSLDYLFLWEKDESIRLVKTFTKEQTSEGPSPDFENANVEDFKPLNLILKAHSQSCLPLETLEEYLKPWCSDSTQSDMDPNDLVTKYIDSAIARGIISVSEQATMDEDNPTCLVVYPVKSSHPSPKCAPNDQTSSPRLTEKIGCEDDCLTTTGSEASSRSRSGESTPFEAPIALSDHPPDPHQPEIPPAESLIIPEDQVIELSPSPPLNLLKQKHPSSSLDTSEAIDRPIKKNKSQAGLVTTVSSSIVRSNSFKKKTLSKTHLHRTKLTTGVKSVILQPGPLVKEEYREKPELNVQAPPRITEETVVPSAPTATFCEGIHGLKNLDEQTSGGSVEKDDGSHEKGGGEEGSWASGVRGDLVRARLSTVWLNCSSGIIIDPVLIGGFSGVYGAHHGRSRDRVDMDVIDLTISRLDGPPPEVHDPSTNRGDEVAVRETHSALVDAHHHFRSLFIPAFRALDARPQPPPLIILNFNLLLQPRVEHSWPASCDLNQVD